MSRKIIEVPYRSQWDADANKTKNDCGATSLAMCINYFGGNVTTNDVFEKTGADQGYITFEQLVKAAKALGYSLTGTAYKTLTDLKSSIDKSIPAIVVLHYGDLIDKLDTFKGPHILVVVGYDDKGVYVNDPDYWGANREQGKQKLHSYETFNKAWQSTVDGNFAGNLWYIDKPTNNNPTNTEEKPTELEDALEKMRKSRDEWKRVYKEEVDKNTELMDKVETDRKTIEDLRTAIATNKTPLSEYRLSLLLMEILSRLTTQATEKAKNSVLQVKKVGGKE
jgi:predicted double-glycine peptidase